MISTATEKRSGTGEKTSRWLPTWLTTLVWLAALGLLAVGIWARWHDLGLPFDRDGYDEGVYWQSLRAMSAGHTLYQPIFYSQPPFFLLSIFPIYTLFGETLWAARLGIVLISLLGLLGAALLGKTLAGRIGLLAGLFLLVADPLYLTQSQSIQAEAPAAALSLLAVALAYLWWQRSEGWAGQCYAALCSITLALSILCKLLSIATLIPVGLLMLAHLWRIFQQQPGTRLRAASSVIVGIVAFVLTFVAAILPFAGAWPQMLQGVISFHLAAGITYKSTQINNSITILTMLSSLTGCAALIGSIAALLRRDWRVFPLIAWFLATVYLLWQQTPLFSHHLVALTPPLVALAIIGIGPLKRERSEFAIITSTTTAITLLAILAAGSISSYAALTYLRSEHGRGTAAETTQGLQVAQDLQRATRPEQMVITDAQFIAALAQRSTPATLVDTSGVRIQTGYLSTHQLIQQASQPQVQAILFYTGRLTMPNTATFHTWVEQHFRLLHDYGGGKELWVRI